MRTLWGAGTRAMMAVTTLVIVGCGGSETEGTGSTSPSGGGNGGADGGMGGAAAGQAGKSSNGGHPSAGAAGVAGQSTSQGGTTSNAGHSGQGGSVGGSPQAQGGAAGTAPSHGGAAGTSAAQGGNGGGQAGAAQGGSGQGGAGGLPSLSCDPSNGNAGAPIACTPDEVMAAYQIMVVQPILPPRFAAGLDLAGNDQWPGLLLSQAENGYQRQDSTDFNYPGACVRLCQSTPLDPTVPDEEYWGMNGEVEAYSTTTHELYYLFLNLGYLGTVEADTRPSSAFGQHHYSIGLGTQLVRDGQPWTVAWDAATKSDPASWANELYDAIIYTYAPYVAPLPPSTSQSPDGDYYPTSCYLSGGCVLNAFGDTPYFYTPSIGFGFVNGPLAMGPASGSTPSDIQVIKTKSLGFSLSDVTLGLGLLGPSTRDQNVGAIHSDCKITLGTSFGDFLANCVYVTGEQIKDDAQGVKLRGGMLRGSETYSFDVQGLDVNFHDDEIGPFDLVATGQYPVASDTAFQIEVDQSMLGKLANDYPGNDPTAPYRDFHGMGLVYLEYARMVEGALQDSRTDICADPMACPPGKAPRRSLGDPACLDKNVVVDSMGVPTFPQGCTGFEGFITSAPAPQPTAEEPFLPSVSLNAGTLGSINPAFSLGLKPGSPVAAFCLRLVNSAAAKCQNTTGGLSGGLFSSSLARVTTGFAKGDPTALPPDARDSVYYAHLYATALAKYLVTSGNGVETPEAVHAVAIGPDDVTTMDAGQYATFRYIEHESATATLAPRVLEVSIDGFNDIVNGYTFTRSLRRSERAEYAAMLDHDLSGAVIGGPKGDDVRLSNVFGSPLLDSLYGAKPSCATTADVSCTQGPPRDETGALALDDEGNPLLSRYSAAIGKKGPLTIGPVGVTLDTPFSNTTDGVTSQWAHATLPQRETPFDPKLFTPPSFQSLVRLEDAQTGSVVLPDASGNGVMHATSLLIFAGSSLAVGAAYEPDPTPNAPPSAIVFRAADATAFEGLVFLCQDPATSELLTAKLGDRPDRALDWMAKHPQAAVACGMVTQTTTSTGLVASRKWGVSLRFIETAPPSSRVNDVTLFDPAIAP